MADPVDPYPAQPKHSAREVENTFYPDGSFFQFDLPPRYVLDEWDNLVEGGIYEVPQTVKHPWGGSFLQTGWSMWADKFQKDIRFAAMSDYNARAQVFNEVHDPWQWTEYVFKGTSKSSYQDNAKDISAGIVEPPMFDPTRVTRTFKTENEVEVIDGITPQFFNDQRPTMMPFEHQVIYELEDQWQSEATQKTYWASELAAMSWVETTTEGENRYFKKYPSDTRPNQRRVIKYGVPKINSGVRIYRHPVFSQATRYGQSQNVPERIINMTAPKDWVSPEGMFTGKIVPKVTIQWGIPIYDNCDIAKPQRVIKYDGYGATSYQNIYLTGVTLTGENGNPDATFTYPLAPAPPAGDKILMPRDKYSKIDWKPPGFVDNDLVHRGCQFWRGHDGNARCAYYDDYRDQFGALWTMVPLTFNDPATPLGDIDVQPFNDRDDELRIMFKTNGQSHNIKDYTSKKITLIKTNNLVTAVRIENVNGNPVYPLKTSLQGGFEPLVGADATFEIQRFRKNRPSPHVSLCGMYEGPVGEKPKAKADAIEYYGTRAKQLNHRPCDYYSPKGQRVVASYEMEAANGAEWANMQRGLPPGYKKSPYETGAGQSLMEMGIAGGGFTAGLGMAYAANVMTPDPYTAGLTKEEFQRIEIDYVPEVISLSGKTTFYDTYDGRPHGKDPEADIRVKQGTGFKSIDFKIEEPYGGTDTPFFGMINQTNYRLLRNVMHCYKPDKCNVIINAPGGNKGWARGWYSAIDFTAHPLRVSGYPAGDGKGPDGKIKHCFTGNGRCPYNNLDRRAHEYNENYKILLKEILIPFRINGVDGFKTYGVSQAFINDDGKVQFIEKADWTGAARHFVCVGVAEDSGSPPLLGHWQPVVKGTDGKNYRVFFYYTVPSWDQLHRHSLVSAHIVQFNDENEACYVDVSTLDANKKATLKAIYGDENKIPWLTILLDNYQEPVGNTLQATNARPFVGGRHPEYKDHSKRYRMVMCNMGGYTDRSFREGATDSNQFGGPAWNRAPLVSQTKMGYWIDKDGDWILDGRKLGAKPFEGYVEPRPRMYNKPGVYGNRWPVDGNPGIKVEDQDAPQFNRSGDWAAIGTTYSNDTKAYLIWLRSVWNDYLPKDPNSDDPDAKIKITPPLSNEEFLPRERFWFRCSKCGIDFSEEEVNYLKGRTYQNGQPFYPIPQGYVPPSGWTGTMAMGCPCGDGGVLHDQGSYDRFMNTYARGYVDVWGAPGSTVRHDAYYWKNPTLVNRIHHDQIIRKLGSYQKGGGGGYPFGGLTPSVEKLGALPVPTNRGYQPGISRQITMPWASPNNTVTQVRNTVAPYFLLKGGEYAVVQRLGINNPIKVANEGQFTLRDGDIITFWRDDEVDASYVVGLPIGVAAPAMQAIMQEVLVQQDQTLDPKPLRTSYEAGAAGDRAFNDALRRWLIGVVYGSLQLWSSTSYGAKNLLATTLQSKNLDPSSALPLDPKTGQSIDVDERIIGPYGKQEAGGLKMVTLKHLKRLRNRLLPMLAYDITGGAEYKAGGDYTDRAQAGHLDRFRQSKAPMPMPVMGTIPPQVLAATQTGKDYFVEWETGDIEGTKARAYYPTGTTWWRMNQKVGQIRRSGGTNALHLDDHNAEDYTGDTITSAVTYFLHGHIPMDKEVIRALLVFSPNDPPSVSAIGCQGQYTGYQGSRNMYGDIAVDTLRYVGHSYCFWQHYHGFTTNHEKNRGGYDHGDSYWDIWSKRHAEDHDPQWISPDNPTIPTIQSSIGDLPMPQASSFGYVEDDYKPWVGGKAEDLLWNHVNIGTGGFCDWTYGFPNQQGQPAPAQNFIKPWKWHGIIEFNQTEHEIWKDFTYSLYNELIDRYKVNFRASVNTNESVVTGTYYGGIFRQQVWSREQQPIPGWINYENYDSSGRFGKEIAIDPKVGDPVQTQAITLADGDNGVSTVSSPPGGGNGIYQAGNVGKVVNITKLVQRLYNDRVDRYFKLTLGKRYSELFDYTKSLTDTNLGEHEFFHQESNNPIWYWNYRYMRNVYGMWLNDPWHHTPLGNDMPATGNEDGDPINQSQADKDARVADVTKWDYQDAAETDPNYRKYHPLSLLDFAPKPFNEQTEYKTIQNPAPADQPADRYWRASDDRITVHQFTMDLRSTPYENERRNWRNKPPETDATNATCPNIYGCMVAQNHWTVGQFLQEAQGGLGLGVIPSTRSEYCAMCRTKLQGVEYKDGDGILTVFYDEAMQQDSIISAVEASSIHLSEDPTLKHGFVVEYWNTVVSQWRTLFSVNFNDSTQKFEWLEWTANGFEVRTNTTLPTIFKGFEQQNGVPKNPGSAIGFHFPVIAAAKLRYRVFRPAIKNNSEPATAGYGTVVSLDTATKKLVIFSNENPDTFVNKEVALRIGTDDQTIVRCFIIDAAKVPNSAQVSLTLTGDFSAQHTSYRIVWKEYVSRCTKFRVWGFPYRKGDVVITPPGFVQPINFVEGLYEFRLNAWPSQFCGQTMSVGEGEPIACELSPTQDENDGFNWEVKKETYDGRDYLKITKGRFYYDYQKNAIRIPTTYKHPTTGKLEGIWNLNAALYADDVTPFTLKTLPNTLTLEYFLGVGMGVDVLATAVGGGPSYQLDRECVCFVAGENDGGYADKQYVKDGLPQMGKTVPLAKLNGNKADMKWQVYNHNPLMWGGGVGYLVGDELPAGKAGDTEIMNLFTGNRGFKVSDLGPAALINGTVSGTVTLYGTPNTILSGDVWVYAKATTARTYNLPDGTSVVTKERTGGMRSGAFVFRLEVGQMPGSNSSGTGIRTGITCGIPRVVIYMRERDLGESV